MLAVDVTVALRTVPTLIADSEEATDAEDEPEADG